MRAYGRLSKKDVGSGTKLGRAMKMDNLEKLRREQGMLKMRTLFEEDTHERVFDQPLKDLDMVDYKL